MQRLKNCMKGHLGNFLIYADKVDSYYILIDLYIKGESFLDVKVFNF